MCSIRLAFVTVPTLETAHLTQLLMTMCEHAGNWIIEGRLAGRQQEQAEASQAACQGTVPDHQYNQAPDRCLESFRRGCILTTGCAPCCHGARFGTRAVIVTVAVVVLCCVAVCCVVLCCAVLCCVGGFEHVCLHVPTGYLCLLSSCQAPSCVVSFLILWLRAWCPSII